MEVRKAVVAGYFYPASKQELQRYIKKMLEQAKNAGIKNIRAVVAPHAAYSYSGQVAASVYKQISKSFKKVVLMGCNHSYYFFSGISVGIYDYYETPLGRVKVWKKAKELAKSFTFFEPAHQTHILEVQLPFLQVILQNFEILPIVIGSVTQADLAFLAKKLEEILDEKTLLIVSSDLSHYHNYETAKKLDQSCIKAIEKLEVSSLKKQEACGLEAIITLVLLAKSKGWKAKKILYMNSGDVSGNKLQVVGYGGIAFYEEK